MSRPLRIAVSVFFAALCIAILALWVRSERTWDSLRWHSGWSLGITSFDGRFQLVLNSGYGNSSDPKRGFTYSTIPSNFTGWPEQSGFKRFGFRTGTGASGHRFCEFPYWLPALLTACMAAVPGIRFNLRTLLAATTLVAVVLGLAVWAVS